MVDLLMLDLIDKGLVTDQLVLTVGYDIDNISTGRSVGEYKGEVVKDRYGRKIPKHAHGTANLSRYTASVALATQAVTRLYDDIVDKRLLSRRINITANHVITEKEAVNKNSSYHQMDLFTDFINKDDNEEESAKLEKEKKVLKTMVDIKKKYGKMQLSEE